ncbi:P-loop NTPase family protein [Lacunimicrobium album]
MPLINISDADIDDVADKLGCVFDSERRTILKCLESKDCRACPGSGKTTILIAKLAILMRRWPWRHRGVCVVSHTNVAKREVQKGFSTLPELNALNQYPHFVGTLQAFIDQFLGVPAAIEHFGVRPIVIDNDRYAAEAQRELLQTAQQSGGYQNALAALRRVAEQTGQDVVSYIANIEYQNADLDLPTIGPVNRPFGQQTNTVQEIQRFKRVMSERGFFRYGDMNALALRHLEQHPTPSVKFSQRFPFVFIDEMQDTIAVQDRILDILFSEHSVVQRIGDDRQAIYRSEDSDGQTNGFPKEGFLSMKQSFRVSPSIAKLSENVCVGELEAMIGNPNRKDCSHTIFLFSKQSIAGVLPAFAELVSNEVGIGIPREMVKAIGATTKSREDEHKFPSCVGDYLAGFSAPEQTRRRRFHTLAGYIVCARQQMLAAEPPFNAVQFLLEGLSRAFRLQQAKLEGELVTPSRLMSSLRQKDRKAYFRLKTQLMEHCLKMASSDGLLTDELLQGLLTHLSPLNIVPSHWNPRAKAFLSDSADETTPVKIGKSSESVYTHKTTAGAVEIELGTIHSVKGETLRAVLVLDTFINAHHLKAMLLKGLLLGQRPKNPGKQLQNQIKRIFVAMTRPTDLLCLALHTDHVNLGHRAELEAFGWKVVLV